MEGNDTITTIVQNHNELGGLWLFFYKIGKLMPKVSACVIGIVFVYSALLKIYTPYGFLAIIYGYEIVSPSQGLFMAHVLPWFELTLGMLLLSQSFLRTTWLLVTIILLVFVIARLMVISSGLFIPCGCYGINEDIVNWKNTTVTIALLIVSTISFFQSRANNP
jgi:hypothetical protein